MRKLRQSLLSITVLISLIISLLVVPKTITSAACKPSKASGKTVGMIKAGAVEMPIKAFNYPAGGVMEPEGSTLAAGLSKRHMPLNSTLGTSVITWHVNYNGCWNELNLFMYQDVGYKFKVTDEDGVTTTYKVERKFKVKKGDYKESWFTLVSPRKLTLVTCTGSFKDGHYTHNLVWIATPL